VLPETVARDDRGRATIRAVRTTEPMRIDGRLDELMYEAVNPIVGFIQNVPEVGQPVSQRTEAWILFDADNIYVSAKCWDSSPESEWVANEMRRDGNQIRQNDNFGVIFDTFHDLRNGTIFYTNPLGGMMDIQVTNEANSNQDWNTIWAVRTGRFEGGWTVEMQIPFKSLRYRPGARQVWGVQMRRGIRRRNEWAYITALPPTDGSSAWQRLSTAPTLVGLEVPAGSKNIEIKPYAISSLTTDRVANPPLSRDPDGHAGVDVKYGITQNVTADFTYNTDFAQVEVDEQQINLTRFNLLFPEKREFFLEGRGLFEFGRPGRITAGSTAGGNLPELFFSRQIGLNRNKVIPIIGGARAIGTVGRSAFGVMNMETDAESLSQTPQTNFTVLRVKRDVLRHSSIGGMFTNRSTSTRVPEASNHAFGVDGTFSFYQNLNITGYYARTATNGLDGHDESYYSRFDYNADRYGLQLGHLMVGDAFNPEVGFVRRDDMRRTAGTARFSPRLRSNPRVRRLVWEGNVEYIENLAGHLETRLQSGSFDVEFQNSDRIAIDANRSYEYLDRPFAVNEGVRIPVGGYSFDSVLTSLTLGPQHKYSGVLSVGLGEFYDGTQTSIGFTQGRVSVTRQFAVEPGVSVNWIDLPYGSFATELYRARLTYAFSPRMFVSGLVQYSSSTDTVGTNVRLRWEYSPGSELFVAYTSEQETDVFGRPSRGLLNRAVAIKVNRLFRF
jgi:hypothetical protein